MLKQIKGYKLICVKNGLRVAEWDHRQFGAMFSLKHLLICVKVD